MLIEEGNLYFIRNEFIKKYNKKYNIMENKENTNRPCYFCFRDNKIEEIIWFVPLSSKYEKYKKIEQSKIKKYGKCYNYVFDNLIGKKQVFLIQNMFPTLENYIEDKYIKDKKDVFVPKGTQKKIMLNAKKMINLAFEKNMDLTFSHIVEFYKEIIKESKKIK